MRAKPRQPSGSFFIPVFHTRSAKSTTAALRWTGWIRSRKEGLRLPPLRRRVRGKIKMTTISRSTSSIHPATLTLRSKLSVLCVYLTVRLPFSAQSAAYSHSLKRFGDKPISMAFQEWFLSTRWTESARISLPWNSRSKTGSKPIPYLSRSRSVPKKISKAWSILSK